MDSNTELIEAVREETLLYEKSHPHYFHKTEKEKAWNRISQKVEQPRNECERRWILLRERYARELRKQKMSSENPANLLTKWKYFNSMEFLKDQIKTKPVRINEREEGSSPSIDIPLVSTSCLDTSLFEAHLDPLDSEASESHDQRSLTGRKKRKSDSGNKVVTEFIKTLKIIRSNESKDKNYVQNDTDTQFFKTITDLMKDLPERNKDSIRKQFLDIVFEERKNLYN